MIERCDFLIDMHSGDGNEALRPYVYWNKLGLDDAVDATARGKAAITTEAGELGVPTDEMIATNVQGAFRVMRYLGMSPGPKEMMKRPRWIEPSEVLVSPSTGVWFPAVRPNQQISDGALIGSITDYFGETIAEVRSPLAGVVLYSVLSPAITEGEPLAMVGSYLNA